MVVCKFFLQGTCKFGTHCHYDHQVPTNYSYSNFRDNTQPSTSILRQSNFGNANTTQNAKPATTPANVDINTLVKAVATDMLGAEKGGQWLMSSYAPFKEKPEFPGFEDQSFEEIRFGFYDAQKNGTMEQYKQQLQMLLQSAIAKVRALQNPTPEICNILQQIYNTPVPNKNLAQSTSNQQSSNIFATQNQSTFGQQQNTNIFATKNIFGVSETNQATNNVFGNTAPSATPNQNIFASSGFMGNQSSSNFGVPQTQNTNFGNQQPTNIFGSQQPASTNVFATPFGAPQQQQPNIFATAPQQPQTMFGAQPTSTPPSVFEHQKQQNIFAAQNQPLQNVQPNMFASQQQTQNVFAPNSIIQQNAAPPPDYSASIFGTANTNQGVFGAKQEFDETLYSKLEDLSEAERKWFESDNLDILNIPDKPPTYEMCFKV
ncbi:unnamed protein product [Ceutorhynchus assimilis]|uniref:Nucleoporin NUP42 n=1 Tax=Ceutorhynchus assimilis TaxID=467358 RepID=A0A9N9MIP8_9CUCU|nr:unnamed protein product [Ceutorhynchus assimilis]